MTNIDMKTEVNPSPSQRPTTIPPRSLTEAAKRLPGIVRKLIVRPGTSGLQSPRFWLLAVGHLALFGVIYWMAYQLRFGFEEWSASVVDYFWTSLLWVLAVKLLIFYVSGHYHGWWRYVTFADLAALCGPLCSRL